MFQKEKRHSSVFWKAFHISTNYFLLHRHFNTGVTENFYTPPMEGFCFEPSHSSGNSCLASYSPFKILAFEIPFPFKMFRNFNFLEPNILSLHVRVIKGNDWSADKQGAPHPDFQKNLNFFWDIGVRFLSWECWDIWRWNDYFWRFQKKSEVFWRCPKSHSPSWHVCKRKLTPSAFHFKIRDCVEVIVIY